jgi:AraC family transcriptional regulator, activator of mtrCDE
MDILSEILRTLRLRATVFLHACFYGDWAVDTSGERRATFHMIASGDCWLHLPDRTDPIPLSDGDLIVFPHDARHTLSNSEEPPDESAPLNQLPEQENARSGVNLICGFFDFDRHGWNPLIDTMPEVMVIRNEGKQGTPLSDALGYLLRHEVEAELMGSDLVIDKLSEVLFIYVVRSHVSSETEKGFMSALADMKIGKALKKIHETPASPWSVEKMAQVAGMSRSAFSKRFTQLVKLSPIQYLSCWRMTLANELLMNTSQSVAQAAEQSGYESVEAFAKAFKKHFGYGPGKARKKNKPEETS